MVDINFINFESLDKFHLSIGISLIVASFLALLININLLKFSQFILTLGMLFFMEGYRDFSLIKYKHRTLFYYINLIKIGLYFLLAFGLAYYFI